MKALIHVTLKKGVFDPQGEAVSNALRSLNYQSVKEVRQGKYFEVKLNSLSKSQAEKQVHEMCEKLLANTVIEDFSFEIIEGRE